MAIIDSNNIVWSVNFAPAVPNLGSGVMATGQTLTQSSKLYSPDSAAYVAAQADGNLVLCALPGQASMNLSTLACCLWCWHAMCKAHSCALSIHSILNAPGICSPLACGL